MKILALVVLISMLSMAAGAAKVAQVPSEMAFLQSMGLSPRAILLFGGVQIVGAILSLAGRTRIAGLWLVSAMFLLSAALIFYSGSFVFGVISLLPVGIAVLLIIKSRKAD